MGIYSIIYENVFELMFVRFSTTNAKYLLTIYLEVMEVLFKSSTN